MRLFGANPDLTEYDIDTWFLNPPGILCLHQMKLFDAPHASSIASIGERMMVRFPRTKRFIYVHDFSQMGSYTSTGRVKLTQLGLDYLRKKRIDSVYIIMPPLHSIVRMGIQTAVMSLRVAGIKIEVHAALDTVIAKAGLTHHVVGK
jgi:hypothetical protein